MDPELPPDQEYVDAKVLARRLGFSARLLQKAAQENKIPHLRLGARVSFKPEDVIKALRRKPC